MILEFKTARSKTNGIRKYLAIDTDKGVFSRVDPHMITQEIEIKTADYNELIRQLSHENFLKVNDIQNF